MAMDISAINKLLSDVALDHSDRKPDEAIQKIAQALMHMAAGIEELRLASVRELLEQRGKERP